MHYKQYIHFLYLLCILGGCFISLTVFAQDRSDDNALFKDLEKPLPEIPVLSKDELVQQFKFIEEKSPGADPYSGFVMFIPKSWVAAPPELIKNFKQQGKIIGDVAKYYSDLHAPVRSAISIEAHARKSNVSAKNWLVNYLIDYGYLIEGVQGFDRNKAEAIATLYNVKDIDYRHRVSARINGDRVIVVHYSVPVPFWDDEKIFQATTLKTFNLTLKDTASVYQTLTYDLNGWAEFEYPDTWFSMLPDTDNYDRISVNLARFEKSFYESELQAMHARQKNEFMSSGLMNVRLIWFENLDTTLVDEIDLVKKSISERGYEIVLPKMEYTIPLDYPADSTVRNMEIYKMRYKDERDPSFELWIASMKYDGFYFIVTMLMADKDEQYLKWIENKSAFELVVSSFDLIPQYDE